MEIITIPNEMTSWSRARMIENKKIALVPTMGFFHEGHLSLMRKARELADLVVVSLFVNPIQFGLNEDLDKYPRDFERDSKLAQETGVDMLFAPAPEYMYPKGSQTRVTVSGLTDGLCGKSRPGHFEGVTTVVAKLFNIVLPHVAVFGKKDFQQLAVIRQMVRDLNWDISIYGHPIVREADGLAMSSRNTYLSDEERKSALCLRNAILLARKRVREGVQNTKELTKELGGFICSFKDVTLEYVDIVDKNTLKRQDKVDDQSVLALAAKVGKTRLIDNDELFEGE